MDTGKALIAGLIVTVGLLAVSYGFEGIAQVAGPEEVEVHSEKEESHGEDEAEDIELHDDEDAEDEADEADHADEDDEDDHGDEDEDEDDEG